MDTDDGGSARRSVKLKMFGFPGSSVGATTQGPSDVTPSLPFSALTTAVSDFGLFASVHLPSSLVRSFLSILLQCLYFIPSLFRTFRALFLAI